MQNLSHQNILKCEAYILLVNQLEMHLNYAFVFVHFLIT